MALATEPCSSTALAVTLPECVFTRTGSSIDPRNDVWEWTDGPFHARIDFGRYDSGFRTLVPFLKQTLVPFLKRHSSGYLLCLNNGFCSFAIMTGRGLEGVITPQHISNYLAHLPVDRRWRVSTLSVLLRKWLQLGLPGVDAKCETYLLERRIPGGKRGEPVRTRDPVRGPLSEDEYTALHSAVNAAYGRGELPLWTLLLTRLLLASGGRISQYASLKICDFDSASAVLNLPQAKTREQHMRTSFLAFDISPQTARLMSDYIVSLREMDHDDQSPLFPASLIMPVGPRKNIRSVDDLFYGHCLPRQLSSWFVQLVAEVAPPTARLDFAPLPVAPKRFRYTFGTRMAEEGASRVLIANRLGHSDLQHVEVYVAASPKVVENIDRAMGTMLAPLAQAFQGRVVEDEEHSTHKGAPGSRIIDFRVSSAPVGSCAGKGGGCAFNKPVACYTCFRFEPWLDAPHEKVLQRLQSEREKWSADERMAAVNDEPIQAVVEVVALCAQIWQQRAGASVEATS
ncbi:integrase [Acidovorax sp. SRB_14]|uniref:site-specific integrase n=1 Tax=Acidovorax sp. SRB_14 TaxID=1962699 RepID=UPI00156763CC|nr:site-specific integrase [Acidovorax sp. SRB_14]NMM81010.1 integrase [Acidovorax sp. SRB_14]